MAINKINKHYLNKDGSNELIENTIQTKVNAWDMNMLVNKINEISTEVNRLSDSSVNPDPDPDPDPTNFIFNEDFNGNSLDLSKWDIINTNAVIDMSNSELGLSISASAPASSSHPTIALKNSILKGSEDIVITYKWRNPSNPTNSRNYISIRKAVDTDQDSFYTSQTSNYTYVSVSNKLETGGSTGYINILNITQANQDVYIKHIVKTTEVETYVWANENWILKNTRTISSLNDGFYIVIDEWDSNKPTFYDYITVVRDDFSTKIPV